jgi:hypothetical protein
MKTKFYILFIALITGLAISQPLFLEQTSGVTTPLNYVITTGWSGSNVAAAWVCGDNGVVLKTTSLGGVWVNVSIPSNLNLNTIAHNRDNSILALAAGVRNDTAIVYRTTDGGTSWSVAFRQYQGNINAIYFNNTSGIMIGNPVGGRWSIWKTTNQGVSFDSTGMYLPRNGTEAGFRNSFCVTQSTSTFYIFGTNNYRLYYSTNQGSSWLSASLPQEQNIYAMSFPNYMAPPNNFAGYAGGASKVYYTTNSGLNWSETAAAPGTGNINGMVACPLPVEMIGNFDVMISKNDNNIYRVPTGMTTWLTAYTAPAGNYRYISNNGSIGLYSIYAVRDNGGISWGSCGTYGVQRISDIVPNKYSLSQNYPNPFNPTTKITFDIPVKSNVRLSVFDVLGKEVARLVEQNVTPGQYQADWDATNMPSGVYFYSLLAGDFTQSKKMILVK